MKNYRPATRSSSRKMQRIYPYHFSLMFGWNGKQNLECEMTSLFDARYYWNESQREVDIVIIDDKLVPIEVKEASKLGPDDTESLEYFMSKFKIHYGMLIYNGEQNAISTENIRLDIIPAWKAFIEYQSKNPRQLNPNKLLGKV